LYLAAVGMLALMAFVGLGIDMGVMRYQKRLLQSAADAAAISAANNLAYVGASPADAAQNALPTNGFPGASTLLQNEACPTSVSGLTVTVNNPPQSGQHTGSAYVEVCVAQLQSTFFMKVFGFNNATVSARAVAGTGAPGNGCLYTLDPVSQGIYDISVNGHPTINAPTCGIVDDGDLCTTGNAFDISAYTFGVAGYRGSSGGCQLHGTITCAATGGAGGTAPCPATGIPPASNPLSYLTPPSGFPCGTGTGTSCPASSPWAAGDGPNTYSQISIGANANVTFSPGLYIIDGSGGMSIGANATVKGSGVTFYFTNGATINATGNSKIQLSACGDGIACAGGAYSGLLFYQDATDNSSPSLGGDNTSYYQGALYFPSTSATLTLYGNNGFNNSGASYTIIVTGALAMSGNPTLNLNPYPSSGGTGDPLLGNPVLVE